MEKYTDPFADIEAEPQARELEDSGATKAFANKAAVRPEVATQFF